MGAELDNQELIPVRDIDDPRPEKLAMETRISSAGSLALARGGFRFGGGNTASVAVSTGLLMDRQFLARLAALPPFALEGDKTVALGSVGRAVTSVQAGCPLHAAVENAGKLRQALQTAMAVCSSASEALVIARYSLGVSWLIVENGWRISEYQLRAVGYELISGIDPALGEACQRCNETDTARRVQGFEELLSRVRDISLTLSESGLSHGEMRTDPAFHIVSMAGNIALREMRGVITDKNLEPETCSHLTKTLASSVRDELLLKGADAPRPFLDFLMFADRPAYGLFASFIPQAADVANLKPEDWQARRCLLAVGCKQWSRTERGHNFFLELQKAYGSLPDIAKAHLLWALRRGVGEDPERSAWILDHGVALLGSGNGAVCAESIPIIASLGERVAAHFGRENAALFSTLDPKVGGKLLHEVAIPRLGGQVSVEERDSILAMVSNQIDQGAFEFRPDTFKNFPSKSDLEQLENLREGQSAKILERLVWVAAKTNFECDEVELCRAIEAFGLRGPRALFDRADAIAAAAPERALALRRSAANVISLLNLAPADVEQVERWLGESILPEVESLGFNLQAANSQHARWFEDRERAISTLRAELEAVSLEFDSVDDELHRRIRNLPHFGEHEQQAREIKQKIEEARAIPNEKLAAQRRAELEELEAQTMPRLAIARLPETVGETLEFLARYSANRAKVKALRNQLESIEKGMGSAFEDIVVGRDSDRMQLEGSILELRSRLTTVTHPLYAILASSAPADRLLSVVQRGLSQYELHSLFARYVAARRAGHEVGANIDFSQLESALIELISHNEQDPAFSAQLYCSAVEELSSLLSAELKRHPAAHTPIALLSGLAAGLNFSTPRENFHKATVAVLELMRTVGKLKCPAMDAISLQTQLWTVDRWSRSFGAGSGIPTWVNLENAALAFADVREALRERRFCEQQEAAESSLVHAILNFARGTLRHSALWESSRERVILIGLFEDSLASLDGVFLAHDYELSGERTVRLRQFIEQALSQLRQFEDATRPKIAPKPAIRDRFELPTDGGDFVGLLPAAGDGSGFRSLGQGDV